MRSRIVGSLLAIFISCSVLVSCLPPPAAQTGARRGGDPTLRFLALGDSYTIGEGVAEADRWPVQLAGLLRAQGFAFGEPEIIARTGWTTAKLSAAIERERPHGPYALVSLLIGVNNQYFGRDPEEYRTEFVALLRQAIGFAGGHAGHVVVISIPDWSVTPFAAGRDRALIASEIDHFNAINREETARLGARYVDITPGSRAVAGSSAPMLVADGLHPSGAMYRDWTRAILPAALEAVGASSR